MSPSILGGILAANIGNTPNPFAMSGDSFPIIETTLIPQHIIFSLAECFCLHNNPMPRAWRLRNQSVEKRFNMKRFLRRSVHFLVDGSFYLDMLWYF